MQGNTEKIIEELRKLDGYRLLGGALKNALLGDVDQAYVDLDYAYDFCNGGENKDIPFEYLYAAVTLAIGNIEKEKE